MANGGLIYYSEEQAKEVHKRLQTKSASTHSA